MTDLHALIASPWWRWMPGMLAQSGLRVDGIGSIGRPVRYSSQWSEWEMRTVRIENYSGGLNEPADLPDLTDPATVGCLLAIMYAAEAQHVTPNPVSVCLSQYGLTDPRTVDALITAILAAPAPGVSDVG